MGQGLHTKVAQIAASAFNIPLSSVFISETSTDKVSGNVKLGNIAPFMNIYVLLTTFFWKRLVFLLELCMYLSC